MIGSFYAAQHDVGEYKRLWIECENADWGSNNFNNEFLGNITFEVQNGTVR